MSVLTKVVVDSRQMRGGTKRLFQGREKAGLQIIYSEPRNCIALGVTPVSGAFRWKGPTKGVRTVFRINGMWDMFKNISHVLFASVDMKTEATMEIALNGTQVFNGRVRTLNYRRWRFWPQIEFDFPAELLHEGENQFTLINHTIPFKPLPTTRQSIPASILENTVYQVSDVQVLVMENTPPPPASVLPDGVLLGHMYGGHEGAYPADESFDRAIDIHLREEQGNMVAFMLNYDLLTMDIARVDAERLRRAGLYATIRDHLNYTGSGDHDSPPAEYDRGKRAFIRTLGDRFLGFGCHEQHGEMRTLVINTKSTDIADIVGQFLASVKHRFAQCRKIKPGAAVWDTDPSLYHRYYLMAGASFPAIELCATHVSMTMASARGTAKAYGLDTWAAINSWECQCFGGLSTRSQDVKHDPDFLAKRKNIFWLTQHMLYLSGARMIYTESGGYSGRLTTEMAFDNPFQVELRRMQKAFCNFAQRHPLKGQPTTPIAYLQGRHDVASAVVDPAFFNTVGHAGCSWKAIESCYPNFDVDGRNEHATNFWREKYRKRESFSDTPYGPADIVPIEASPKSLNEYKLLILSGWNTWDDETGRKLEAWVRRGGILSLYLPHFTRTTKTDCAADHLDAKWLRRLCGVSLLDTPADAVDAPIERLVVEPAFRKVFPEVARLAGRQPREIMYRGKTYGALVRRLKTSGRGARCAIREANCHYPFLIENRLGKGRVYLFALADWVKFPTIYEIARAAVSDLAAQVPQDVRLKSGRDISYCVYPVTGDRDVRCRVYAVASDWFGRRASARAVFTLFGKDVPVSLPRNQVRVIEARRDGTCKVIRNA